MSTTQHNNLQKANGVRHLFGSFLNDRKKTWMTNEMAIHPDPTLIKLDPIWGYFCISDHNLILNIYGDTHDTSLTETTTVEVGA
jgi:hypothetical protein